MVCSLREFTVAALAAKESAVDRELEVTRTLRGRLKPMEESLMDVNSTLRIKATTLGAGREAGIVRVKVTTWEPGAAGAAEGAVAGS